MKLVYSIDGQEVTYVSAPDQKQIIIGRAESSDISLRNNQFVAPKHATITLSEDGWNIEHCGSRIGTKLNDKEIKHASPLLLHDSDRIRIGGVQFHVHLPRDPAPAPSILVLEDDNPSGSTKAFTSYPSSLTSEKTQTDGSERVQFFYDLPLQLARHDKLEDFASEVIKQIIELIPHAQRGALFIIDSETSKFLPKGSYSRSASADDRISFSRRLAKQSLDQRQPLVWNPAASETDSATGSLLQHNVRSAMYAPLCWQKRNFGVVYVDNCHGLPFGDDDLHLLDAVAHHAALAISDRQTREELRLYSEALERLFGSRFPPRVRSDLVEKLRSGRLRLGTEFSQVTVLNSDIRGFTELTREIRAQRMTDLLNDYFPPLVEAIFEFGGSIEKFVGDAIFAVFGSPEPDANQHENAVRAAQRMQEVVREVSARREKLGLRTCEIGIGIDCGKVVHGFVGNAERIEFTVVGDAANFASRYCSKAENGEVLISEAVRQHVVLQFEVLKKRVIETKHEGLLDAYPVKLI